LEAVDPGLQAAHQLPQLLDRRLGQISSALAASLRPPRLNIWFGLVLTMVFSRFDRLFSTEYLAGILVTVAGIYRPGLILWIKAHG